jgi:ABC-type polysaccharide/polyol phosphate export permease
MRLAFLTAALASGFAAAGITALLIWIISVFVGSPDPWSVAPALVIVIAAAFAAATYVAERMAYRRTLARKRSAGEPWAFREN